MRNQRLLSPPKRSVTKAIIKKERNEEESWLKESDGKVIKPTSETFELNHQGIEALQ